VRGETTGKRGEGKEHLACGRMRREGGKEEENGERWSNHEIFPLQMSDRRGKRGEEREHPDSSAYVFGVLWVRLATCKKERCTADTLTGYFLRLDP